MKGITKDKANKIVSVAYNIILDRNPAQNEIDQYVTKLVNDEKFDDVDIVHDLLKSAEYSNMTKDKDAMLLEKDSQLKKKDLIIEEKDKLLLEKDKEIAELKKKTERKGIIGSFIR